MRRTGPGPGRRAPLPVSVLHHLLDSIPPASGAVVMGTGIVSVALRLDGRTILADAMTAIAAVAWLGLAVLLPARALRDRERFVVDLRHPTALTSIAGTGVLGTSLTLAGFPALGVAALVVALGIWIGLVPHVLRHWQLPTTGASFIVTVATESLALLAATLADRERTVWLLFAALGPFLLGLCFYVAVLVRFDPRQLLVGIGDHWVTGGALAISTVVSGRIALAAQRTGTLWSGHGPLEAGALVLWSLTMVWLPLLIGAELARPRLRYSVRRWSTVFPVGMYAACSFFVGRLTHLEGIVYFAEVWVWLAVAVWIAVACGMLRRTASLGAPEPAPG
ncbi:MAG: tellurite resistance/C4-dicarboxylate transporter family protein [Solirubrobacteraceae bacterium]